MTTSDTLYIAGWRQGSVLSAIIPTLSVVKGSGQICEERRTEHGTWVIVTQDCTLAREDARSNTASIEIRQVLDSNPPLSWGISSRRFLLDDVTGHYIVDGKPAGYVSPRLLESDVVAKLYNLSNHRVLALKTWLGRRYDRPAVPDELVPLAKAIAEVFHDDRKRLVGHAVREVYASYDASYDPPAFSLYAVIVDEADPDIVREWLAEGALEVRADLGTASELEALRSNEASIQLVESTYCVDLSLLTWGADSLDDAP